MAKSLESNKKVRKLIKQVNVM